MPRPSPRFIKSALLLLHTASLLAADPIETLLFSENFDGSGQLHGTTPEVSLFAATWVAAAGFGADGSIPGTVQGSATLPLVPEDGYIYTLDATLTGVTGDQNWIALGFANGQSSAASANDRFITGNVVGTAWMLVRGSNAVHPNTTFLGTGLTGGGNNGLTSQAAWPALNGNGGDLDLRVVLDTTAGGGTWTATLLARRPDDAEFTVIRTATPMLTSSMNSVGVAVSNSGVHGTLASFSLTYTGDPPPPPPPPPEPLVSFISVTDGDPATDENGYAGSAINSIAFAQNNLITVGDQQFIAYYRRHASDSAHPENNTVVIGRRMVGEAVWEMFSTDFVSFNINDLHNVISMAIDGDGHLHMSWGMHVHPLLYAKSTTSVLGEGPIVMASLGAAGMTGQEASVTYPILQTLPDGDLLFLYRRGGSGNGDWFLNRFDSASATWSPVHANANGVAQPLFKGTGFTLTNCFYPDRLTVGPDGMLHISGVFRYNSSTQAGESGYQTNHRYVYMRSPDGGTTWHRSNGSLVRLPAVNNAGFQNLGAAYVPEIVKDLAEGHSIMNEAGMTTDSAGRPIIANWWSDDAATGDHTRQYQIFFHDGSTWHQRTVSSRNIDNPAQKFSEGQLGSSWMGRPVVLTDADDRIIVVYNDNRFPGITVVFSESLAQDPGRNHWTRINITDENIGFWETNYDEPRWKQDGVLQMLYQKLPGSGMNYGSFNNSTPVAVVEWDANAYFNGPLQWEIDTAATPGHATISARTLAGFRHDLKTSTDLDFSAPPIESRTGNGSWQDFGSWPMNEPRRFWRIERVEQATNDF